MNDLRKIALPILFLLLSLSGNSQPKYSDARNTQTCLSCAQAISEKPKEVLFGIEINRNGDVFFSMNDTSWFKKIFKTDAYGVAVDIIPRSRYDCGKNTQPDMRIPRGTAIAPVYRKRLLEDNKNAENRGFLVKVGKLPASVGYQEAEGNLMILNGDKLCYYTHFVNIDRLAWQLLPMGFYLDSFANEYSGGENERKDNFTYERKIQIEIPFAKGSSSLNPEYLKKYFDTINFANLKIKKLEIRAYSSVEGSEALNRMLMTRRAARLVEALKMYQPDLIRIHTIAAENWIDFYNDIKGSRFEQLAGKSKPEIKQQLTDPSLLSEIEPILSHHRKVIALIYVDEKGNNYKTNNIALLKNITDAVKNKEIRKTEQLLKDLSNRIAEKQLPVTALTNIEVPQTKEFSSVLSEREMYKYTLQATNEYETLQNLLNIRKVDSTNGKLNYNICVLRFFTWQYADDSISRIEIPRYLPELVKQGIPDGLAIRMMINYYILKSEDQLNALDYTGKDSSTSEIRHIYAGGKFNDEDIYSLARYYSFYSHPEWAEEIITPRIRDINVSEDLIFYYLNLLFFHPDLYGSEEFGTACLNATNLNRNRFCQFFKSINAGGASMQLLEHQPIKKWYCTECNK